jgi:hypothetical protein
MTDHLDAICDLIEARLAAAPAAAARRLLRPQLSWVDQRRGTPTGDELAYRTGVVRLVESCRDEHLASLDADDGLTVILLDWREVVHRACERARANDRTPRCPRCGERMLFEQLRGTRQRHRCASCRIVRRC